MEALKMADISHSEFDLHIWKLLGTGGRPDVYTIGVRENKMPPIPLQYLDCVIYLYRSPERAKEGSGLGGSGFLVGVPFEANPEFCTIYAATNKHVFEQCGEHPAIRLNKTDGAMDVLVTNNEDWRAHSQACDVAVCPIQLSQGADGH